MIVVRLGFMMRLSCDESHRKINHIQWNPSHDRRMMEAMDPIAQ